MDNVVMAQKVQHSMRIKKGKKGWLAVKIDMERHTIDFNGDSFRTHWKMRNFLHVLLKSSCNVLG